VPADHERTFVHFTYSYDFGALAKTAMSVYFNTVGREKVGFTVVDSTPDGRPVYIGGLRGALERNIMRYYLAMKAYLGALSAPPQERLEKRLKDWFALTERYPLQFA
jgi:ABC-type ATPase with predicted acetyltransferase domain